MFRAWWRVEEDYDFMVNKIPETFASMGFGVEDRKLHVLSCVHHVIVFTKVKLIERNDEEI